MSLHTADYTNVVNTVTQVIAVASVVSNLLPHPDKTQGVLNFLSKFVNFLAVNLKTVFKSN